MIGNSHFVSFWVNSNVDDIAKIEAAIAAATINVPIAYEYELATAISLNGANYSGWARKVSTDYPTVPAGSIRNLRPLVYGDSDA